MFIPSVGVEYTSTHHADILCGLGPMMDEAEWMAKGLNNYGLIAVNSEGNAAQVITTLLNCSIGTTPSAAGGPFTQGKMRALATYDAAVQNSVGLECPSLFLSSHTKY